MARFNPFPDAYRAGAKTGVIVTGIDETKRQMRQLAPDLLKEMNFEVRRNILGPIVKEARSYVPASPPTDHWNRSVFNPGSRPSYSPHGKRWDYKRLEWDSRRVEMGIRLGAGGPRRRGDAFKGTYSILNRDPAGAVFELMGRGKSRANMIGAVRGRHGASSRLIWRAYDKARGDSDIPKRVTDTIRLFEAKFQERLDSDARGIR